jgi:hypothetical protein
VQTRFRGVNQPPQLRGAQGKTIEFSHTVSPYELMLYFTDGTYVLVKMPTFYNDDYQLQFEYVEE